MKKNYSLEFEIVELPAQDVIATSGEQNMSTNNVRGAFSGFNGSDGDAVIDFSGVNF